MVAFFDLYIQTVTNIGAVIISMIKLGSGEDRQISLVIFAICIGTIFFALLLTKFKSYTQARYLEMKDSRLSYFRNVLNNIEYVKMRSLENFYSLKIFEKREEEIKKLNTLNIANAMMVSINFVSFCMGTSAFLWYLSKSNKKITYAHFGEIFAIFIPCVGSCSSMSVNITTLVTRMVSLKRMERFLNLNSASRNYVIDDNHMNFKAAQKTREE